MHCGHERHICMNYSGKFIKKKKDDICCLGNFHLLPDQSGHIAEQLLFGKDSKCGLPVSHKPLAIFFILDF